MSANYFISCKGLEKIDNSGQNNNFDWLSSYPNWSYSSYSHHNDHNHDPDLDDGNKKLSPSIYSNDGQRLKRCHGNCNSTKSVVNGSHNCGKDNSCFYCWRTVSEGAKKPTYKELYAFENSRQDVLISKKTPRPHSIHISSPRLNKHGNGISISLLEYP